MEQPRETTAASFSYGREMESGGLGKQQRPRSVLATEGYMRPLRSPQRKGGWKRGRQGKRSNLASSSIHMTEEDARPPPPPRAAEGKWSVPAEGSGSGRAWPGGLAAAAGSPSEGREMERPRESAAASLGDGREMEGGGRGKRQRHRSVLATEGYMRPLRFPWRREGGSAAAEGSGSGLASSSVPITEEDARPPPPPRAAEGK